MPDRRTFTNEELIYLHSSNFNGLGGVEKWGGRRPTVSDLAGALRAERLASIAVSRMVMEWWETVKFAEAAPGYNLYDVDPDFVEAARARLEATQGEAGRT